MTIRETIQKDKLNAFKNAEKKKATILSTVIGEFDRIGKNLSDDEYIRIIKKIINNCKECKQEEEIKIISEYLPKMISEEELKKIIEDYCNLNNLKEKKDIGIIMKYLKENYSGKYDGKTANKIITNIIKLSKEKNAPK